MQTNETTNETTVETIETVDTSVQAHAEHLASEATAAAQAKLAKAAARRNAPAKPSKPAKQPASANGKAAAKRVAAKPVTPAKPTQAERERAQADASDARRLARDVAAAAVSAFYSGSSKPFKAASDRFADINSANGKSATARQAGLMLALITYGTGNMRSNGTFVRGAFIVPARLIDPNAKPGATVRAQPESGCLGNMLGRACDFVSGPRTGREQSAAIYRLRINVALAEIQAAFGDKAASAARKLLAGFDAKAA